MGQASVNTADYPTLLTVMNLTRVYLNDWQKGLNNVPGEGQITTDDQTQSPQTLPALNSSIRELYRKLRNIEAPTLIKDNVQVNLPAINSALNPPNPLVQTALTFTGFFDGLQVVNSALLPSDMIQPLKVSEQQTNSGLPFVPMNQAQFGLQSCNQGFLNLVWEWRQDALNFPGTLQPVTISIRYLAAFPQFFGNIDFATTQIPILDCEDFLSYRTAYKVALALEGISPASQSVQQLKAEADDALIDLKKSYVRRAQTVNYSRAPYGDDTSGDFSGGGII